MPQEPLLAILLVLYRVVNDFDGILDASWKHLGGSWTLLGGLVEALGVSQKAFWGALEPHGDSWTSLGGSGRHLEGSWRHPGGSWASLGWILQAKTEEVLKNARGKCRQGRLS